MIFELPVIRKEAYQDIDKAVIHILKNTLDFLDGKSDVIDVMTETTYKYYCHEISKKGKGF